jgi:hypothetical protein
VTTIHVDANAVPTRDPLRDLVRADALVCLGSGLALLVAAAPVSDLAGVATTGPARVVGAFFFALGIGLAALGAASHEIRERWVPVSAIGDIAWALASLAVAILADLTGPGRALVAAQGLLALAIGELKPALHRRARADTP